MADAPKKPEESAGLDIGDDLVDIAKDADTATAAMSGWIEQLEGTFTSINALSLALKKSNVVFGDTLTNISSLNERLVRSTSNTDALRGSNKALLDDLFKLSAQSRKYGISVKDNYGFIGRFSQQNVKLLDIFKKNKVELADFAGRMQALKVPLETSSLMVGELTSKLDMNVAQLDSSGRALVGFAKRTGQSVKEVVSHYAKSIKSFMDWLDPKEMNRSFMQFQVMARRMGTEASSLYALATKFDTIEQSQQMGAKMNQIFSTLGIEFNALALQEMDPKERIDYIARKTRLALTKAKGMGGREGRLLVRALGEAGLGDISQVRALGSEGGGRRATTAFERGGGRAVEATKDEEKQLAARLNFYNIEKANIKYATEMAFRRMKYHEKITDLTLKAPEMVVSFAEKQEVFVDRIADAQAVMMETAAKEIEALFEKVREVPIPKELRAEMNRQGITNARRIKKIIDVLEAMAEAEKRRQAAGKPGRSLAEHTALTKGMTDLIGKAATTFGQAAVTAIRNATINGG
jgi:hypothetical protein